MLVVDQASLLDGVALDAFSVEQDRLGAAKVDVGWGEVAQALVAALVVGLQHDLDLLRESGEVPMMQEDPHEAAATVYEGI